MGKMIIMALLQFVGSICAIGMIVTVADLAISHYTSSSALFATSELAWTLGGVFVLSIVSAIITMLLIVKSN